MLRIKVVRKKHALDAVYFNGKVAPDTWANRFNRASWEFSSYNRRVCNSMLNTSIQVLQKQFLNVHLDIKGRCHPFINRCDLAFEAKRPRLALSFEQKYQTWSQPFTVGQFLTSIKSASRAFKEQGIRVRTHADDEWADAHFYFGVADPTRRYIDEVERCSPLVSEILDLALEALHAQMRPDYLTECFRFPAAIQTACAQYLTYFVQFLQDLGIEAATEVQQQANEVLFTVKPSAGREALDRIREALEIYLYLPSMPASAFPGNAARSSDADIAVLQLVDNVIHLRRQLKLVPAAVRGGKNIEQTPLALTHYSQPPTELHTVAAESEPLIGDFIQLHRFRWGPFDINLPGLLRRLKRIWRD